MYVVVTDLFDTYLIKVKSYLSLLCCVYLVMSKIDLCNDVLIKFI
jgi:hypothetical protein